MRKFHLRDIARDRMPISITLQRRWVKGGICAEHLHDAIEIVYVLKGGGVNFIDGQGFPIIPGSIYIVNCGSTHSFNANPSLLFYNLLFTPSALSPKERKMLGEMERFPDFFRFGTRSGNGANPHGSLFLPPPLSSSFRMLFERLHKEMLAAEQGWRTNCKAYLLLLITEICRARALLPDKVEGKGETALGNALAFINSNFLRSGLQLSEVAKAAGLSENYMSPFFHTKTGMGVVKYITSLRLEKARAELSADEELNIAHLAQSCGFTDASYFTKVFREAFGVPPSVYRNKLAQGKH